MTLNNYSDLFRILVMEYMWIPVNKIRFVTFTVLSKKYNIIILLNGNPWPH